MSSSKILLNERYEIIREIGKGGMSVVYYVKDIRLSKYWAMKKVKKENKSYYQAFINEVKMISKLQHKGIPKCIDFFENDDAAYIVMEYIKGVSLHTYQYQRSINVQEIEKWMLELCDIFIYLHTNFQMSILYLDLKPQNIMIDENQNIYLIDFGSACFAGHIAHMMTGTPRFYSTGSYEKKRIRYS